MSSGVPTVRSLAAQLKLSRTTVSDALRGSSRVKAATVRRIREAAEAVGYRPNPLASALMSELRRSRGQTFRGGLAVVDIDETDRPAHALRYHQALMRGAKERAEELGFKLQTFLVGRQGVTVERLDTILQSRGIQGVLLLPAWRDPDLSRLDWTRYAGVYMDYMIERPALHAVCCDHYRSVMTAMARLSALGYRRPGLFLHRQHDERLQHRWGGAFLTYQRNHDGAGRVPPLIADELNAEIFKRWFLRHQPDVVLGHSTELLDWLPECGARVPETAGFFCLNVTMESRFCAGLDQQPRLLAARGVELLIAQLQRNERGIPVHSSTTMIPAHWVDGPSVASRS